MLIDSDRPVVAHISIRRSSNELDERSRHLGRKIQGIEKLWNETEIIFHLHEYADIPCLLLARLRLAFHILATGAQIKRALFAYNVRLKTDSSAWEKRESRLKCGLTSGRRIGRVTIVRCRLVDFIRLKESRKDVRTEKNRENIHT